MSFFEDKAAIEGRLAGLSGLSGVLIKFSNANIKDPGESNYISVSISDGEAKAVSLELTPLRRYTGSIVVHCFTKDGIGGGSAVCLADTVADGFRGAVFASGSQFIHCYTPLLQDMGADGKGFYQYTVGIPFKRDQKH